MKNITREFFFHVDKPKICHPKFYEIPRLGRCPTYEEFTLTTFQGTIDKVTYLYRNRNSDLHPKLYSTIKFEIHWLENKLHALYGQEEDGEEEQHDNGLDPILWRAVERVIRCMVQDGYAVKEERGLR